MIKRAGPLGRASPAKPRVRPLWNTRKPLSDDFTPGAHVDRRLAGCLYFDLLNTSQLGRQPGRRPEAQVPAVIFGKVCLPLTVALIGKVRLPFNVDAYSPKRYNSIISLFELMR
jgi:hypothetical protein